MKLGSFTARGPKHLNPGRREVFVLDPQDPKADADALCDRAARELADAARIHVRLRAPKASGGARYYEHTLGDVPVHRSGITVRHAPGDLRAEVFFHDVSPPKDLKPRLTADEARRAIEKQTDMKVAHPPVLVWLARHEVGVAEGLAWRVAVDHERMAGLLLSDIDMRLGWFADDDRKPLPEHCVDPQTECLSLIDFRPLGGLEGAQPGDSPAGAARRFFSEHPRIFATWEVDRSLRPMATVPIPAVNGGGWFVRFQAIYAGMPVFGSELVVELDADLKVRRVSGGYIPRLWIPTEPAIAANQAKTIVINRLLATGALTTSMLQGRSRTSPPLSRAELERQSLAEITIVPELGVFPGQLIKGRAERPPNALAWFVRTPWQDAYVDAKTGAIVYSLPAASEARHVFDAKNKPAHEPGDLEFVDGQQRDPAFSVVARRANDALERIHAWFLQRNWTGWKGTAEVNEVVVVDLGFSGRARFSPARNQIELSHDITFTPAPAQDLWLGDDVIAHEFAHAVVRNAGGRMGASDEPGAVNESLADTFAELVFPSPVPWRLFESVEPAGFIGFVDLAAPQAPRVAHMSNFKQRLADCAGNRECEEFGFAHDNSAIATRAAAVFDTAIADRNKVEQLYLDVLTRQLTPTASLADLRLALGGTAQRFADTGAHGFTFNDVRALFDAFNTVGILPLVESSWFSHDSHGWPFGDRGDHTEERGADYFDPPGCTLGNVVLTLETPDRELTADRNSTPPNELSFADRFGVSISYDRGGTSKAVDVHWWHIGGEKVKYKLRWIATPPAGGIPPGISDCDFKGQRFEFLDGAITRHYGGPGDKNDDTLNDGRNLQPTCVIRQVYLLLVDSSGNEIDDDDITTRSDNQVGSSSRGARIVEKFPGTQNMKVKVHWWYEANEIVRYRLLYVIDREFGSNCGL
jgi:hypothetical protein